MPIDPNIALSVQVPQVNALGALQQGQNLALQREQVASLAQERQANAAILQQKIADQRSMDQAVQGGGSSDDIVGRLPGHLQATARDAYAKADQAAAAARESRNKADMADADYYGQLAASVKAFGYDPQAAQMALAHAKQAGHDVSPVLAAIQQFGIQPVVDNLIASSPAQRELAIKQAASAAQTLTAQTGANRLTLETPELVAKGQQAQDVLAGMKGGLTPEQQQDLALKRQQVNIAGGELALKQKTFEAQYSGGLNPQTGQPYSQDDIKKLAQSNPQAQMMANYQIPGPSSRNVTDPKNRFLLQQVQALNPAYSSDLFGTRQKFVTGPQGQTINAINTAMGHLDQLDQVAKGLQNGSFKPGNQLYQAAATMFGGQGPTDFNTLKQFLDGELGKVAGGGSTAHEGEIQALRQNISSASSPQQISGFIKTAVNVMNSKLGALDYQYHSAMGKDDPFSALSPESKAVVQKFTGGNADASGRIRVKGPNGESGTVPKGTTLPAGWSQVGG